jgi:hypothetical protein
MRANGDILFAEAIRVNVEQAILEKLGLIYIVLFVQMNLLFFLAAMAFIRTYLKK